MKIVESTTEASPRVLTFAFVEGRFGRLLVAADEVGVCFAGYRFDSSNDPIEDLQRRFPKAELREDVHLFFRGLDLKEAQFHLIGTPFQLQVWRALREIRAGERISYAELAARIGRPSAVRAVASAVARNPIAYYVPCHRVVHSDGTIGQYHWGTARKQRMLDVERAEAISSR